MVHSGVSDASAEQIALLLRLIDLAQTVSDVLSQFASRHKLTGNDCYALAILSRYEAITAKELGILGHMQKSGVSRVMRSLARQNLITWDRNHLDRRKVTLVLTPRGADLGREILMAAEVLTRRLEQTMSHTEREGLLHALELVTFRMKEVISIDNVVTSQRRTAPTALN
jgi:DNA-binding MarR family transcriptional regulator